MTTTVVVIVLIVVFSTSAVLAALGFLSVLYIVAAQVEEFYQDLQEAEITTPED
jgi:hypothetical protein